MQSFQATLCSSDSMVIWRSSSSDSSSGNGSSSSSSSNCGRGAHRVALQRKA